MFSNSLTTDPPIDRYVCSTQLYSKYGHRTHVPACAPRMRKIQIEHSTQVHKGDLALR